MDAIDIVDPTFALDIVDNVSESICENISDIIGDVNIVLPLESSSSNFISSNSISSNSSSSSYWFIGGLLLLVFVGMFAYKRFANRNSNDCVGGFCNINTTIRNEEVEADEFHH